jgi:hypothetical protein
MASATARKRQVGGDQRHPHAGTGQHHHHARGGGVFCQIFGMAAEWHAGIVDHALVYWRGHHAGKFAGQTAGNGCIQRIQHITAIARIQHAGGNRHSQRHVQDFQRTCRGAGWPGW